MLAGQIANGYFDENDCKGHRTRHVDKPAAHSVAAPQRGFIRGRRIEDNMYELEGAFCEYSCSSRSAAVLLLDSRAAVPSLGRKFMFSVLERLRLPLILLSVVYALYHDLTTAVVFVGETVAEMRMDSGIKQGSPLSGALFALALDTMVRRYLAELTMASSRLCAFADDVGVAMWDMARQLRELMESFAEWACACALHLTMQKCLLIPDKARGRVADIRMQRQSMAARVYLFKAYGARLFLYTARFVDIPATVLRTRAKFPAT